MPGGVFDGGQGNTEEEVQHLMQVSQWITESPFTSNPNARVTKTVKSYWRLVTLEIDDNKSRSTSS